MIDPLWTDEQIAAWTSSRDVRYWVGGAQTDSLLPTAAVTALLRALRDETAQRMAVLVEAAQAVVNLFEDDEFAWFLTHIVDKQAMPQLRAALDAAKEPHP